MGDSKSRAMQKPAHDGGGYNPKEYIELIDSLTNALTNLSNSVSEMNNELRQTKQLLMNSHSILDARIRNIQLGIMHYIPKAEIAFSIELAEHCNLNCAGCDHFSPLAKSRFPKFEDTARDFARLAELFNGQARYVQFAGGEPLLNPEITKFIVMAHQKFPKSPIRIITNGLKLPSMPEEFWNACRDNNVVLAPTKYPIAADYEAMKNKAAKYGIPFRYFNEGQTIKTLFKLPLDFNGLQDGRLSFFLCHRANNCLFLQRGRLYTCAVAAIIWRFDEYFGTHLFDEEANSIDIYKNNSVKDILEFLARPIPFCRFCKIQDTVYNIPWHKSNKEISEWT